MVTRRIVAVLAGACFVALTACSSASTGLITDGSPPSAPTTSAGGTSMQSPAAPILEPTDTPADSAGGTLGDQGEPSVNPLTGTFEITEGPKAKPGEFDNPESGITNPYPGMTYQGAREAEWDWLNQNLHSIILDGVATTAYPSRAEQFTAAGWAAYKEAISDPSSPLINALKGTDYCEVISSTKCVSLESLRAADSGGAIVIGFADGDVAFTLQPNPGAAGQFIFDRIEAK